MHTLYIFQAFSIYNSAAQHFNASPDNHWNVKAWEAISALLETDLRVDRCQFYSTVRTLQASLQQIRTDLKSKVNELDSIAEGQQMDSQSMKGIIVYSNDAMSDFVKKIVQISISFMNQSPPCDFSVVGIGSTGRGEATPFSDLEYIFLIENPEVWKYFERLAVMGYFLIGSLRETNLKSIAVDELEGWFVDMRKTGFQIDGITNCSGNVPTGSVSQPNAFIVTPEELTQRYLGVYNKPDPRESLRGDLTAMLSFTTLIYTNQKAETLLSRFIKARESCNKTKSPLRLNSNLKMFENDMRKFTFSAEYDFYSVGFSLDVKRLLYRFPSLLLLNLTTIIEGIQSDSWSTLDYWASHDFCDRDSSVATRLFSLLAVTCYTRLRCYLFMDSHFDQFQLDSPDDSASGLVNKRVFSTGPTLWKMAKGEFFQLAEALMTMQHHFQSGDTGLSHNLIEKLVKQAVKDSKLAKGLAHFFCCEWFKASTLLEPAFSSQSFPTDCWFVSAKAAAFSSLQCRQYTTALQRYDDIIKRTGNSLGCRDRFEIFRCKAKCHVERGEITQARESC